LSVRLGVVVAMVSAAGVGAGVAGLVLTWTSKDLLGLLAIIALVGIGQALALEVDDAGSISVSAVGCLAGAALFGPRAPLARARDRERRRRVERASVRDPPSPLQHGRTHARIAGGGERLQDRRSGPRRDGASAGGRRPRSRGRGRVLRREHGPSVRRARARGTRALVGRVEGGLRLAPPALPRLRVPRRPGGPRLRGREALRARGLRRSAGADAEDPGG